MKGEYYEADEVHVNENSEYLLNRISPILITQ